MGLSVDAASPLAGIVRAARVFLAWCRRPVAEGETAAMVFAELRGHLVEVYREALAVPRPPDDDDDDGERQADRVATALPANPIGADAALVAKLELLPFRYYRTVFVPTKDAGEPVRCDLWDDVISVAVWFEMTLDDYDAGRRSDAWWDFWWDLDGHAGHHLASALNALQAEAVFGDNGLGRNDN